jgi:hypothetical protein
MYSAPLMHMALILIAHIPDEWLYLCSYNYTYKVLVQILCFDFITIIKTLENLRLCIVVEFRLMCTDAQNKQAQISYK